MNDDDQKVVAADEKPAEDAKSEEASKTEEKTV